LWAAAAVELVINLAVLIVVFFLTENGQIPARALPHFLVVLIQRLVDLSTGIGVYWLRLLSLWVCCYMRAVEQILFELVDWRNSLPWQ